MESSSITFTCPNGTRYDIIKIWRRKFIDNKYSQNQQMKLLITAKNNKNEWFCEIKHDYDTQEYYSPSKIYEILLAYSNKTLTKDIMVDFLDSESNDGTKILGISIITRAEPDGYATNIILRDKNSWNNHHRIKEESEIFRNVTFDHAKNGLVLMVLFGVFYGMLNFL